MHIKNKFHKHDLYRVQLIILTCVLVLVFSPSPPIGIANTRSFTIVCVYFIRWCVYVVFTYTSLSVRPVKVPWDGAKSPWDSVKSPWDGDPFWYGSWLLWILFTSFDEWFNAWNYSYIHDEIYIIKLLHKLIY